MQCEMISQRNSSDEAHQFMKAIGAPTGDGQGEIQLRVGGFDEHTATMIRGRHTGEANQRLSPRVRLTMHLAQLGDTKVRVDLGGRK